MAKDLNDELDETAARYGFRFTSDPFDFIQPAAFKAQKKAYQLKQFLDARKAAAELSKPTPEEAAAQLLGLTAFAGANATPEEAAAFRPGQPLNRSTFHDPTPGLPAGTVDPALEADLRTQLRDEELNRADAANAPAVEAMRRSLLLHDTGADENKIAAARANMETARLRGGQADEQDYRFGAVKNLLDNPELDPLLGADIAQDKAVFKSERVKVNSKDGREVYYDRTPNLSGGYDYAPALDKKGQALRVPESGERVPKNVKYLASLWFPDDPDAERKAADRIYSRKSLSREDAWKETTRDTIKKLGRQASQDPQKVYDTVLQNWRLMFPGVPPPVPRPEMPGTPSAPRAAPGSPAPAQPAAPVVNEPTAINRQTGQRLVFRNGQWQPLK